MRRRRVVLGIAAIGVVVALAGCGASSTDATVSIKTLRAAADNTQSAESYRYDLEETVRTDGKTVTITGSGTSTADGKAATAKLELPDIGTIEYRLIDGVMYIDAASVGALSSKLPSGKQWLRVDLKTLSALGLGELSDQATSTSPNQGLKFLGALSGDPENLGVENVNGTPATHYRGDLDYSKLGNAVSNEKVKAQLAKLGPVPVDVWIDDSDHVVKLHMKIDASAMSSTAGSGTVEITMTITDIDEPVVVEAPPASQVFDLGDLLGTRGTTI